MPYKPKRINCRACGAWVVEIDGRGQVTRSNRKVVQREVITQAHDGVDVFMFPGAAQLRQVTYVCACRRGEHRAVFDISPGYTDTL